VNALSYRVFRRWFPLYIFVLVLALCSCEAVDPVQPGETCERNGDTTCRTPTVALYCKQGHWFERDCWTECRYLGYEVGSCGLHSSYGGDTCFCAPHEEWTVGAACGHEGNQSCYSEQELRVCADGQVREVNCRDACAGHTSSFCGYDAMRGDDSCICCDTADCP
jgi:hypothetical protein